MDNLFKEINAHKTHSKTISSKPLNQSTQLPVPNLILWSRVFVCAGDTSGFCRLRPGVVKFVTTWRKPYNGLRASILVQEGEIHNTHCFMLPNLATEPETEKQRLGWVQSQRQEGVFQVGAGRRTVWFSHFLYEFHLLFVENHLVVITAHVNSSAVGFESLFYFSHIEQGLSKSVVALHTKGWNTVQVLSNHMCICSWWPLLIWRQRMKTVPLPTLDWSEWHIFHQKQRFCKGNFNLTY